MLTRRRDPIAAAALCLAASLATCQLSHDAIAAPDAAPTAAATAAAPAPAPAPTATAAPGSSSTTEAVTSPAPAALDTAAPTTEAQPATPADAPILEQLSKVKAAYDAYKAANGRDRSALLFALLAAITWFLLRLLREGIGLAGHGKKALPWLAVGAGAIAGVLTHLAGGGGLVDSLVVALGPIVAALVHWLQQAHAQPATA